MRNLGWRNSLIGRTKRAYSITATGTLTYEHIIGGLLNNLGQGATTTATLPACRRGIMFTMTFCTTGNAFHLKPAAADKFILDGTALDNADKITTATPAVGDSYVVHAEETASGDYNWIAETVRGTHTDGGA